MASGFYEKDHTANIDRQFRQKSSHHFFVREPSVFHLYLNTLESGVRVHYSILDHNNEVISQDSDYKESSLNFGMITPLLNPHEAMANPYTLLLLYEHEHHHHD